jgi:hypothetical protein
MEAAMFHLRQTFDPSDLWEALAGAAAMAWTLGFILAVEVACGKFIHQAAHASEKTAMHALHTQQTASPSIPNAARRLIGLAVAVVALAACSDLGANGTGTAQLDDGGGVNAPYFLGGNPLFRNGSAGGE